MARIAGVNIPQNKIVQIGLTYIYGIGDKFSKQICGALDIPKSINKDININRLKKEGDDTVNKVLEVIYQYL